MLDRRKPTSYLAAAYACLVPLAQEIARPLGYCVSVHGSMARDVDLLAVPWTEDAVSAHELFNALFKAFTPYILNDETRDRYYKAEKKPHGRLAWTILLFDGPHIDLSVMPRLKE